MGRLLLLAALLPAALCGAQYMGSIPTSVGAPFPSLGTGSAQPVLVDPRRIQMSQSITVASTSGGGGSLSQTLYSNRIDYRLSDPLVLHLNLGLLTPVQATGAYSGLRQGTYVLPEIGLDYRPSESVLFSVRCASVPSAPLGSSGSLPWR